jgi:glycosyltransferase involved in cell wall biosynthesis
MLVSAVAGAGLRAEVEARQRPLPDYLQLERELGVELFDWSRLGVAQGSRSWSRSARQVRAAWPLIGDYELLFTDGEHLAIPLAIALRPLRRRPAHASIAHHLLTPSKRPFYRLLQVQKRIDAMIVHSSAQKVSYARELDLDGKALDVVPYGVDTNFWHPDAAVEENLVLSPGREQRDHRTLVAACAGLNATVVVTAGSAHSPGSRLQAPIRWPENFSRRSYSYLDLRSAYQSSALVAVPLVECGFAAGITTVLEGMAMGKAVVASATAAISEVIQDGVTGRLVAPGDADGLREAVRSLLADPIERRRLGANARAACVSEFSLDRFAERLGVVLSKATESRA